MHPIRILIADDDADFCTCLAEMLSHHPMLLLSGIASNGEMALQKIDQLHPDMVLLDNCMPYADGIAVIERMTEKYDSTQYQPTILVLSSWNLEEVLQDSIKNKITYFFKKPVDFAMLIQRVLQIAENQDQKIQQRISEIYLLLDQIGLNSKGEGYRFLAEGLLLISHNKTHLKSMAKTMYPEIARRCSCSPRVVDRKMQYEIERLFTYGAASQLEKYLSRTHADKGKPTNKQFLTWLSQDLGYL